MLPPGVSTALHIRASCWQLPAEVTILEAENLKGESDRWRRLIVADCWAEF
jgi:hypothetical protein